MTLDTLPGEPDAHIDRLHLSVLERFSHEHRTVEAAREKDSCHRKLVIG